jgi:hypothetical protein
MAFIEIRLDGAEEIGRKLASLSDVGGKKIVIDAIKKSLQPALQRSKSNASSMVGGQMGGWLASALFIKPFKRRKKSLTGMNIAISKAFNDLFIPKLTKLGIRHYIPAAIEYGHVKANKTIEYRAAKKASIDTQIEYGSDKVPAIPFMRSAADSSTPSIISIFEKEFTKSVREMQ